MRSHRLQRWLVVGAMLVLPVLAHAQDATLNGTVTDANDGSHLEPRSLWAKVVGA